MKEFVIYKNDADQRVDKFIQKTMHTMPKALMYKYIRNKKIKVNRKRCEIFQRLEVGDVVQCYIAEEFFVKEERKEQAFLQFDASIDIVYEDDDILIVNKPSGLLAHRDTKKPQDTLSDRILHYLYNKKMYDPEHEQSFTPALCHRIDRNTQGLVIAAKNAAALRAMNAHIQNHEVIKKYICIVQGVCQQKYAHITLYHQKDAHNKAHICATKKQGYKKIESRYCVLSQGMHFALVEVALISGKSHQIRAMMAYLHHPLVGDVKYGARKDGGSCYQQLCAYSIAFHFTTESVLSHLNHKVITLHENPLQKRFEDVYKNK